MKKIVISILLIGIIGTVIFLMMNKNQDQDSSNIDKSLDETQGVSNEELESGDYVQMFIEETDSPEDLQNIVVKLDYDVTEFKFIEGKMEPTDAGTMLFKPIEVLGYMESLKAGEELLIQVMLESTMPSRGMSFKTQDGETKVYSFNESGKDGSVVIVYEEPDKR